ncbi:MAG: 3-hydroxyacyl-CoA dehydrogenase NAD-binding domain-containing protein [Gemmatimonadetes bacterium]|nr:3-hydroxyacyl-CoA dehydrogenase NAD-binding domain-containing protein [Gemmatimonadota bacterium]
MSVASEAGSASPGPASPGEASPAAVAVVGTGVIGRSWIRVFARAGFPTRIFDPDSEQVARAVAWARTSALGDVHLGFCAYAEAQAEERRITVCQTLGEALDGVTYVQECGPEAIAAKQSIFRELDAAVAPEVVLGSSTSAHDMTAIAGGLPGADRCIVAHPVNPPHVIPLVEVLAGAETRPDVTASTLALLRRAGMAPVVLDRYAPGFVLNRLQAAVLREAVSLVRAGVASPEVVDIVMRDGLGLRWALMGPFGTGHVNADDGVGSYYRMYGDAYRAIWQDLELAPDFGDDIIDAIDEGTTAMYGEDAVAALSAWRDRMVRRIIQLKAADPGPGPAPGQAPATDRGAPEAGQY